MRCRLVPEYLILQLVRLRIVIDHQTFEVLRTLVHDLTERIKIRKHTGILLIELTPIAHNVLTEDEDIVDVRAQRRRDTHRVLHRDDEHCVDVTPVHEKIAHISVTNPRTVIQTVVQNQEVPGIHSSRTPRGQVAGNLLGNQLLALQDVGNDQGRILLMDEDRWHNLAVEMIRTLRTGNHRAVGNALVMPQQVLDQKRLAGFALADEHHDLVVLDFGHVKLLQTEVQATGRNSSSTYWRC